MLTISVIKSLIVKMALIGIAATSILAQTGQPQPATTTHANILRGEYGRYRANNDLLFYYLNVRVDPQKKFISGKNTIRFRMLKDDTRIQLDLYDNLKIDQILQVDQGKESSLLRYERDSGAVFVDFPETLKAGRVYTIDFYYSGTPQTIGRFGGFTFGKDPESRDWIFTACEGEGASIWWPNKDQWKDEVESMRISVAIPNGLTDVSNGKFIGKTDLGDGYTRWDWLVQYPINNYDVSLNIGKYEHFSDHLGDVPMDFYALPEDLARARKQFAQAKGMIEAYQHYFGEYPFKKDGYKLIEAPYSGMEHQSAVTYGNHFANGYLERDWTGVGISPRFDFIIIHESGHEWFGNSITAADRSDMWIHEGWTTYLEGLYVEFMYGKDDGLKYLNGYKSKVRNQQPIIPPRGINATPPQDMYFKGALFLNTLRSVINDDARWWGLLKEFYQHFKYQTIMTEDIINWFNQKTRMNLTPVFNQYLRHTALPTLVLKFGESGGSVSYRWKADEPGFAMPVRVGTRDHWQIIQPTLEWQTIKTPLKKDQFEVATDLYFIDVTKIAFSQVFVQRSRFTDPQAYPATMTPVSFVKKLADNAGVPAIDPDRTKAVNEFGGATNTSDVAARGRALRDIAENASVFDSEQNRANVLAQYFGYLRRDPNSSPDADYTGYEFWLTKLNQFNGDYQNAEMVKAFISSTEYRQRFGP